MSAKDDIRSALALLETIKVQPTPLAGSGLVAPSDQEDSDHTYTDYGIIRDVGYICHSCDNFYHDDEPNGGYLYDVSYIAEARDGNDSDRFIVSNDYIHSGDYVNYCHNEDYPCIECDYETMHEMSLKCDCCAYEITYVDGDLWSDHTGCDPSDFGYEDSNANSRGEAVHLMQEHFVSDCC